MKDNIFFWHWDEFLIQDQIRFWEDNFIKKNWDINLEKLNINNNPFHEIAWAILAPPFLWEKRLVFIKWIPTWTKDKKLNEDEVENIIKTLKQTDETSLIVLISPKPDKRLRFFKQIKLLANFEELKHPDKKLNKWVFDYCEKRNIKISQEVVDELVLLTGKNLFRITNEIKKLKNYTNWLEIKISDINDLIKNNSEVNIFKITALISSWKKTEAFNELQNLIRWWEDLMYVFNLIVRQIRLLIWCFEIKWKDSWEIWRELKIAPFVASWLKKQVNNFKIEKLLKLHKKLYLIDKKIKTWKLKIDKKWKLLALEIEKEIILAW